MAQILDKDGALGQVSKNFQVYLIHMNILETKKNYNSAKEQSYAAMLLYSFFDSLLSSGPKQMETEK